MATQRDVSTRQLVKLREFSTQLAQRLKEAPNLPTEPTRLAVRIGAENYLVEMGLAAEVVSLPEIARVPWTKPWYRGLANVRGRLVGVVDLQQLVGREPLPRGTEPAVAGAQRRPRHRGRHPGHARLRHPQSQGSRARSRATASARPGWERSRYRDLEGMTLTELDLRELAAAPAFGAIHA